MVRRDVLSQDDGRSFLAALNDAERRGEFFAAATFFSAWGTRPPQRC